MRSVIVILVAATAASCASSAEVSEVQQPRREVVTVQADHGTRVIDLHREDRAIGGVLQLPADEIWPHVPRVYEEIGISVSDLNLVDPAGHRLGVVNFRTRQLADKRLSVFLDCGMFLGGSKADKGQTAITLETWLESVDGGTQVMTRFSGVAQDGGTSTSASRCTTNGEIERDILIRLARRVAIEETGR